MKKKMTEVNFKAIKMMVNGGATIADICEVYPIGRETLRRIKRCASFAEYQQMQRAYQERSIMNRNMEPEQLTIPETLTAQVEPDEKVALLRKQTEILISLEAKIGSLLKELTGKEA